MKNKFRIILCSDVDYEELVADISYGDGKYENFTIAMVRQENGIDKMEIEIFFYDDEPFWEFPLDDFLHIVIRTKQCLLESQKIDETKQ